jgi:hypothetical protein
METLFVWLFSGAWAWFLGKIGMSPEEKLGRAEVTNTVLTDDLKEKTLEAQYSRLPIALSLLCLTTCLSTPASNVCPPPVWPDLCTVKWLASIQNPSAHSNGRIKTTGCEPSSRQSGHSLQTAGPRRYYSSRMAAFTVVCGLSPLYRFHLRGNSCWWPSDAVDNACSTPPRTLVPSATRSSHLRQVLALPKARTRAPKPADIVNTKAPLSG